jgi:hypothetical protein
MNRVPTYRHAARRRGGRGLCKGIRARDQQCSVRFREVESRIHPFGLLAKLAMRGSAISKNSTAAARAAPERFCGATTHSV